MVDCCYFLPSCRAAPPFGWYQVIVFGVKGYACGQLAQTCYTRMELFGLRRTQLRASHLTFSAP